MSPDPNEATESDFKQPPTEHPYLRASHTDRQNAKTIIDRGLAEGRLTASEHAARSEQAERASTQPELNILTSDLVVIQDAHQADDVVLRPSAVAAPFQYDTNSVNAMLATKQRNGAWVVPPQLALNTVMGEIKLDLREAIFESNEVVLNVTCVMGGVKVWAPAGTEVIDATRGALSEVKLKKLNPTQPPSLRLIISGMVFMGEVTVYGSDHITLGDRIMGKF